MRFRPSNRFREEARWPVDSAAAVMDAILMSLLAAALALNACALLSQRHVYAASSYDIYDSVMSALARLLLPSKQSPATSAVPSGLAVGNSSVHRWQLPTNHTGMEQLGGTIQSVTGIATLTTCSNFLHGVAALLAIVRALHSWSFQPSVRVITRSFVLAAPRMVDLMVLTSIVLVMLAGIVHVSLGTMFADLNTPGKAMYFVLVAMVTGDLGGVPFLLPARSGLEVSALSQVAGYMGYAATVAILQNILCLFFLVILISSYYEAKHEAGPPAEQLGTGFRLFSFKRRRLRVLRKALSSALRVHHKGLNLRAQLASAAAVPTTPDAPAKARSFIRFQDLQDHMAEIPLEVLLKLRQVGRDARTGGGQTSAATATVCPAPTPRVRKVVQMIGSLQKQVHDLYEMVADVDDMILQMAEFLKFPDQVASRESISLFTVKPLYEPGLVVDQSWWPSSMDTHDSPQGTVEAAFKWLVQKVSGVRSWLGGSRYAVSSRDGTAGAGQADSYGTVVDFSGVIPADATVHPKSSSGRVSRVGSSLSDASKLAAPLMNHRGSSSGSVRAWGGMRPSDSASVPAWMDMRSSDAGSQQAWGEITPSDARPPAQTLLRTGSLSMRKRLSTASVRRHSSVQLDFDFELDGPDSPEIGAGMATAQEPTRDPQFGLSDDANGEDTVARRLSFSTPPAFLLPTMSGNLSPDTPAAEHLVPGMLHTVEESHASPGGSRTVGEQDSPSPQQQ